MKTRTIFEAWDSQPTKYKKYDNTGKSIIKLIVIVKAPKVLNLHGYRSAYISHYIILHRKGYVAFATHGRVAVILRMNGSDRM